MKPRKASNAPFPYLKVSHKQSLALNYLAIASIIVLVPQFFVLHFQLKFNNHQEDKEMKTHKIKDTSQPLKKRDGG